MEGSQPPSGFLGSPKISPLRPQREWTLCDQKFSGAREASFCWLVGPAGFWAVLARTSALGCEMSYGHGSLRAAGVCHRTWKRSRWPPTPAAILAGGRAYLPPGRDRGQMLRASSDPTWLQEWIGRRKRAGGGRQATRPVSSL